MSTLCSSLLADETGFLITSELVLISTLGVIGLTAGMVCVRDAVSAELIDVSDAIGSLNQSYCYTGFSAASPRCCKSRTFGSCFTDHDEDGVYAAAEVHGGTIIAPAAPVIEERVIEEKVIEPPCEVAEPDAISPAPQAASPIECNPCSEARAQPVTVPHVTEAVINAPKCQVPSRPVHAVVTGRGETLHYSETRGEVVRMIDPVDAIHRPVVTPRLPLW